MINGCKPISNAYKQPQLIGFVQKIVDTFCKIFILATLTLNSNLAIVSHQNGRKMVPELIIVTICILPSITNVEIAAQLINTNLTNLSHMMG